MESKRKQDLRSVSLKTETRNAEAHSESHEFKGFCFRILGTCIKTLSQYEINDVTVCVCVCVSERQM